MKNGRLDTFNASNPSNFQKIKVFKLNCIKIAISARISLNLIIFTKLFAISGKK